MESLSLRVFVCACAALFNACAAPIPTIEPERAAAAAVELDQAIEFRLEGGPIDAPEPHPDRLTLAAALRESVLASSELQVALARVRMALAEAEGVRRLGNPVLDVALRMSASGGHAVIEAAPSIGLVALFERPRRADAADARLRAAVASAVRAALDAAAETAERYAIVQALDELVQRLAERRALLEKLVDVARARLEFGEASRLDVTTLEAQAVELDLAIARNAAERRDARLALARVLGRPSSAAEWRLDDWAPLPERLDGESAWIATALERRPEIAERRWELAALGDEAALARWSPFAGLSAGAAAEYDREWSLGPAAALPLPVFDDGGANARRADARIVEARHELVRVQRDVVEEVRRAHAALAAARDGLEHARAELIPVQRDRREQVEAIYLAGQADLTAVLLAEQDLRTAQADLVELEREVVVQRVRLERAAGGAAAARELAGRAEVRR